MRRRNLLPLLPLILLVGACATAPRPLPDDREQAWRQMRAELEALDAWRAEGRLVVRNGNGGGQARFSWREHEGKGFSLRLAGPWGQGAARLAGTGTRVELDAADGRSFVGTDARELLLGVYGWDIPVDALRRWLIGLPTPGAVHQLDRFGRIASLQWHGWSLDYRRYRQHDALDLPAVLVARRNEDEVELRIAIDHWRFGDERAPVPDSPVPLMGGG